MDKNALIRSVIAQLEAELAVQTDAALSSRAEATDADSKAEGKYDMRGQSAAYLAEGQARLATEIAAAIGAWRSLVPASFALGDPIAAGALVVLEGKGRSQAYFLGPASGGLEAGDGGETATVVTAASPLGRAVLGRREGETVLLADRKGSVPHRVVSVR